MAATWRTFVFTGTTPDEATQAFDTWINRGPWGEISQPILRQIDGWLYMYLAHVPGTDRHDIYVTALGKWE